MQKINIEVSDFIFPSKKMRKKKKENGARLKKIIFF